MLKYRFKQDDNNDYPDWKVNKFNKVFDIVGHNSLAREKLNYEQGTIKNVHYGDVLIKFGNVTNVNCQDIPYISNQHNRIDDCNLLVTGDIVIADTAEDFTVGKATEIYNPDNFPVTAGLHTIPCKPLIPFAQGYLGQFLNSPSYHNQLFQWMLGAKVYSVNKRDIVKTNIYYPSDIKEQQKIADFLSAVDNQIDIQRQRVKVIETQKKGLLDKVFSQELRFKQDDGGNYPDWEETIVSKGIEIVTDYVAAGSFADLRNNVEYINSPNYAQLVRTTDLKNNFQLESQIYVNKHAFNYLYRVNLNKPSIVLPNVGVNCGEVYYVVPENLPYKNNVLGPNAILLHSQSNNNKYLSCYFMCKDFQNILKGITGYGAKSKFNKTSLRKIRIKLPIIEEQQKIADFFTAIDNQIDIEKQRLITMETIKKGLLQQMFC